MRFVDSGTISFFHQLFPSTMGSFTTEELERFLIAFKLPLDGSYKFKEKRAKKALATLDPNARIFYPSHNPANDDDDNDDNDSLTPPPPPRNTPSHPSSPSTAAASPPPENTSGTANPCTHPSTATTDPETQTSPPSKSSLFGFNKSLTSTPPTLTTHPPSGNTAGAAASSTHPSSGTTSSPQPSSPRRNYPRLPLNYPLASTLSTITTRLASTDASGGTSTSNAHAPPAALSSAQLSPPESLSK